MRAVFLFFVLSLFLASCVKIDKSAEVPKSPEDEEFQKCFDTFMKGNATTPGGDMPLYLKEPIAKEFCKKFLEESKKPLAEAEKTLWGVFVNQGIILPKEGGKFEIDVKNNDGAGDFTLELVKTPIPTMNDINYVLAEKSFRLESWADKKVSVTTKPSIRQDYKLPQEIFPLKIIAKKNGQIFREVEILILVNNS
ncbi:MAG TPA: hypothetical protein VJI46_00360 [Candidatus Nanoarchaeia archaeon]|nr:hypothetical protein [Candidatus Nanoarchaeia archaeon]